MDEFQKYRDEIPFLNDLKFTDKEIELNLIKIQKINDDIKSCKNTKNTCCNPDGQHEIFYRAKNNILRTKFVYCDKFKENLEKTAFLKNYLILHRPKCFNDIEFNNNCFPDGFVSINEKISDELKHQIDTKKFYSLYIFGNTKTCKTKLLSAFCNNLANLNYNIAFVDIKKLQSIWKDSVHNKEIYDELINMIRIMKNCNILVIDELGLDLFYYSFNIDLLLQVFEYRRDNNLPIYFISNCCIERLKCNYLNSYGGSYTSFRKKSEQEKFSIEKFINIIKEIVNNKNFEIKGVN